MLSKLAFPRLVIIVLLAIAASVVSANYQVPHNPVCYGHVSAGFPVPFLCDDVACSPTSSWGKIDYADWYDGLYPLVLLNPAFLVNVACYALLIAMIWLALFGVVRAPGHSPSLSQESSFTSMDVAAPALTPPISINQFLLRGLLGCLIGISIGRLNLLGVTQIFPADTFGTAHPVARLALFALCGSIAGALQGRFIDRRLTRPQLLWLFLSAAGWSILGLFDPQTRPPGQQPSFRLPFISSMEGLWRCHSGSGSSGRCALPRSG